MQITLSLDIDGNSHDGCIFFFRRCYPRSRPIALIYYNFPLRFWNWITTNARCVSAFGNQLIWSYCRRWYWIMCYIGNSEGPNAHKTVIPFQKKEEDTLLYQEFFSNRFFLALIEESSLCIETLTLTVLICFVLLFRISYYYSTVVLKTLINLYIYLNDTTSFHTQRISKCQMKHTLLVKKKNTFWHQNFAKRKRITTTTTKNSRKL